MTEGEPITQFLDHKLGKILHFFGIYNMDCERGMEIDEQYCMPKKELLQYLNTPPLKFVKRKRFMWGLNNVYIAMKGK